MKYTFFFAYLLLGGSAFASPLKDYTPKLGEWVALQLNALGSEKSQPLVEYWFEGANTITIKIIYDSTVSAKFLDMIIASKKANALATARRFGWKNPEISIEKVAL